MQHTDTLKVKFLRHWRAIAVAGMALAVSLVGLPTQPNSPFHQWLLAYLVAASVVTTTVFCGVRAGSKAHTALLSFAVSIAFALNVSAFNTLLARNNTGLDFLAGLVGVQLQTVRAFLTLSFAI